VVGRRRRGREEGWEWGRAGGRGEQRRRVGLGRGEVSGRRVGGRGARGRGGGGRGGGRGRRRECRGGPRERRPSRWGSGEEEKRRIAEVVVVAPRWWTGGQPPPKIKILNYRQSGFLEQKGQEVSGSKPLPLHLNFWGVFWTFWAEKNERLGVKGQGSSMTCPGLEAPIDSFIIL
jgi:hypothetical protein